MTSDLRRNKWPLIVVGLAVLLRGGAFLLERTLGNKLATPVTIERCGVSLRAPQGYVALSRPQGEDAQVVGPQGDNILLSCLLKAELEPRSLTDWSHDVLTHTGQPDTGKKGANVGALRSAKRTDGSTAFDSGPSLRDDGNDSVLSFSETPTAFILAEHIAAPGALSLETRSAYLHALQVWDARANQGPTRWLHPKLQKTTASMSDMRKTPTHLLQTDKPAQFATEPPKMPPRNVFDLVQVRGPAGKLSTYLTHDPRDHKRHPAVVWAHGGFGGIDDGFWNAAPRSNDPSARAFREAGIVLAVGSWRSEHQNPGAFELFEGEVDDFLAIRAHVASLPYVDPERIYLAGHSSGGTLVLLASERSDAFRAAFSIGGDPGLEAMDVYARYAAIPFETSDQAEVSRRTAAPFVGSIRRPTFYFEGAARALGSAQWMEDRALEGNVPFRAFGVLQANHFNVLAPLTELIAKKIVADVAPTTNIGFTQQELDALHVED
jgi:dienelactone hydrolase